MKRVIMYYVFSIFAMGIEKFERFKPDSTLHIYN